MLPGKTLIPWWSAAREYFSSGEEGEIPVFLAYIECGLRFLVHNFLSQVLEYYEVELVNLAPNSIANLSIFVYLCEAYLGIQPNLKVFKYFYNMTRSGKSAVGPGECSLCLYDGKADEYIRMYSKSSWSSRKKSWFYMKSTKEDGLYFTGKVASENPNWRSTVEKKGRVGRWIEAIKDLSAKGLTSWHVVRVQTVPCSGTLVVTTRLRIPRKVSPKDPRPVWFILADYFVTLKSLYLLKPFPLMRPGRGSNWFALGRLMSRQHFPISWLLSL